MAPLAWAMVEANRINSEIKNRNRSCMKSLPGFAECETPKVYVQMGGCGKFVFPNFRKNKGLFINPERKASRHPGQTPPHKVPKHRHRQTAAPTRRVLRLGQIARPQGVVVIGGEVLA